MWPLTLCDQCQFWVSYQTLMCWLFTLCLVLSALHGLNVIKHQLTTVCHDDDDDDDEVAVFKKKKRKVLPVLVEQNGYFVVLTFKGNK